jgi:hypothetical protein
MFRYRIVYPRLSVEMISADGRTNVRVGDATIPNYQTPAQFATPAGQSGPPAAPYATGEAFARKYGQARFESMCRSLEIKSSQPEATKLGKPNAYVPVTAGTATFSCAVNGQSMTGYVYAETMLVRGAGWQPAKWFVTAVGSYLARRRRHSPPKRCLNILQNRSS